MTVMERKPAPPRPLRSDPPLTAADALDLVESLREPVWLTSDGPDIRAADPGEPGTCFAPACHPSAFGDPAFVRRHGLRVPYVCGAMANGIASTAVVEAAARAGGVGFFGSAGLSLERVEAAIDALQRDLRGKPFGV